MNQTINKQKVDIVISFTQDQWCLSDLFNEYIGYRQKYIDKGFTEQQAKYFNRSWEKDIDAIMNDDWIALDVMVKANILMPCDHIEEFSVYLGGYIFDWREMDLDQEFPNEANDLIDELKDKIRSKIGDNINNLEFNIIVDKEIKY